METIEILLIVPKIRGSENSDPSNYNAQEYYAWDPLTQLG